MASVKQLTGFILISSLVLLGEFMIVYFFLHDWA